MEVFHCEAGKNVIIPAYNGPGMSEGKPPGLSVCRRVIGAWAMGATVSIYF
jgi:dopamine beta-monooxygenase